MKRLLEKINTPEDLKTLSVEELPLLSEEIRSLIVETVSKTGGHLASSLGAVELAVALHYVFDTPRDKLIWDVGHQAYAHKILTGRKHLFHTLRQFGGISGFPKPWESPYDTVVSGHSSVSISSGLGMAVGRDLKGEQNKVICIIGDGSMTAGVAFEGLNQAGHLKKDLIVILNDNEMSISKNVGALSAFLSKKITSRFATRVKNEIESFVKNIPRIGEGLVSFVKKAEDSLITLLTPGMLFEGLGFHYVGPIDGHNIHELIAVLGEIKHINGPVLVHILTKKGKGYRPAEENPARFHGIGPFEVSTGKPLSKGGLTYTQVFGSTIMNIAEKDRRIVAVTAAMPDGTGLTDFAKRFPKRFFDVGIAEQHAITFSAGLAKEGFLPVTAIYSTFLQRSYDQICHDICIEGLPVVLALDRAGIVGADGQTHHGAFDLSYLRHLPNMIVCAPKDGEELKNLLWSSVGYGKPTAIRYPRGGCPDSSVNPEPEVIPAGKAEVLREGKDLTIIAIGAMVYPALEAAERLERANIHATVINARFVKPLDKECILKHAAATGRVITVEENALQGGFGSAVLEALHDEDILCHVKRLGIPDRFLPQGTQKELREECLLTASGIEKTALKMLRGTARKDQSIAL